jgi:hypothetical protein
VDAIAWLLLNRLPRSRCASAPVERTEQIRACCGTSVSAPRVEVGSFGCPGLVHLVGQPCNPYTYSASDDIL